MARIYTTTYYDALGNPPLLNVLSFIPITTEGAVFIKIYKRVDDTDPLQDIEVDQVMLPNRVTSWYPYFHSLFNAERDATYVVTYLDSNGEEMLTASSRIETENYFPPIPEQGIVTINPQRICTEQLRRTYLVLERMGEKAILLRKKKSGMRCRCWREQSRKPLPGCMECYGTGWADGYDVFYPFLLDFQPAGERIQLTNIGLVVDTQPRAWAAIVPRIVDGDMIVRFWDESADRYEINNPTRSGKDGVTGVPIIQEFSVKLHGRDHPIYNYPVENTVADYTPPTDYYAMPDRK